MHESEKWKWSRSVASPMDCSLPGSSVHGIFQARVLIHSHLKISQKNWREGNTPKFIPQGYHYPDTKTRQRHYPKKKLQDNISGEYRYKNLQQNISKQNLTIHKKDHIPWSSGTHSRDAMMAQFPQINQCNTLTKRSGGGGGRNHMIIYRYRKSIWQN